MPRVSDQKRLDSRNRLSAMSAAERVEEALRLGRRAVAFYASAHGVEPTEARRQLERSAQAGRRHSDVMRRSVE